MCNYLKPFFTKYVWQVLVCPLSFEWILDFHSLPYIILYHIILYYIILSVEYYNQYNISCLRIYLWGIAWPLTVGTYRLSVDAITCVFLVAWSLNRVFHSLRWAHVFQWSMPGSSVWECHMWRYYQLWRMWTTYHQWDPVLLQLHWYSSPTITSYNY